MKQPMAYELDLTKIQGDGNFPCPNCGVIISPEDETEEVYHIIEMKVKGQDLEELLIQCNRCGSKIRLFGFLTLDTRASTCPRCGVYIDQAEQGNVEGNFCVCSNCFTVMYPKNESDVRP